MSQNPRSRAVQVGPPEPRDKEPVVPYDDDAPTETIRKVASPAATADPPREVAGSAGAGSTRIDPSSRARFDPRPPTVRPPAPRRARLALKRIDPWSVFVVALLVSLFLGVVLLVAVLVLYSLLDSMGVLSSVDTFARDLQVIAADQSVLGKGRVMGVAAVIAAVDVVLLTVLTTLFAFLYNLCASLTGGIEVTLAERD